jgi:hypothetical protein
MWLLFFLLYIGKLYFLPVPKSLFSFPTLPFKTKLIQKILLILITEVTRNLNNFYEQSFHLDSLWTIAAETAFLGSGELRKVKSTPNY